jgi:hypothetical protein
MKVYVEAVSVAGQKEEAAKKTRKKAPVKDPK